jgi:hypothetical protein
MEYPSINIICQITQSQKNHSPIQPIIKTCSPNLIDIWFLPMKLPRTDFIFRKWKIIYPVFLLDIASVWLSGKSGNFGLGLSHRYYPRIILHSHSNIFHQRMYPNCNQFMILTFIFFPPFLLISNHQFFIFFYFMLRTVVFSYWAVFTGSTILGVGFRDCEEDVGFF